MLRSINLAKGITFLFAIIICMPADIQALRYTKQESYTDPDYVGYEPRKVMLTIESNEISFTRKVQKHTAKLLKRYGVEVVSRKSILPPTRDWTPEQISRILAEQGIDSILLLTVGYSAASVIPVATHTYGSSNTTAFQSGNTFSGATNGRSSSYHIYRARSKAAFSAVLIDAKEARAVWYSDITSKAGGTLFVSEKGDAKALVKGAVRGLKERGHISKK